MYEQYIMAATMAFFVGGEGEGGLIAGYQVTIILVKTAGSSPKWRMQKHALSFYVPS